MSRHKGFFGVLALVLSLMIVSVSASVVTSERFASLVPLAQAEEPTQQTAVYADLTALMSAIDNDIAVFDQINYIGADMETAAMVVSFDATRELSIIRFRLDDSRNIYTQADEAVATFDAAWEELAWHDICYTSAPDTSGCSDYIALNEGKGEVRDLDGRLLLETDFGSDKHYITQDIMDIEPMFQYFITQVDDFFVTEVVFSQLDENGQLAYLLEFYYKPDSDVLMMWAQKGEATPERIIAAPELVVRVYSQLDDEWQQKLYFDVDEWIFQMPDTDETYYFYSLQSYKGKLTVQFDDERTPAEVKEYMEQVMDVGGAADYMMIVPTNGSSDDNLEDYYILNITDGQIVSLGAVELDESIQEIARTYMTMLGKKELDFEYILEEVNLDEDGDLWSYRIEKGETKTIRLDDDKKKGEVNSPAPTSDPNDRHASGDNVPNEAKPQTCADTTPSGQADLFQIDRVGDKATLYFAPAAGAYSYHVVFGHQEGDERFGGVSMKANDVSGVLALDISNLNPVQQYSFKIAPVNGCATGNWSHWLTAQGVSRYSKHVAKTYRYQP